MEVPAGVSIDHEDQFGIEFTIPFSDYEPPPSAPVIDEIGLGFEEASLAELQVR
jgi:hypothetical protein